MDRPLEHPAEGSTPIEGVTRYAPVAVEVAPSGFTLPGLLASGRIDVVDDDAGSYGPPIVARLQELGCDAHLVTQVSAEARAVIFARGLSAVESHEQAVVLHREALRCARTLAHKSGPRVLVTLQDTGGDFGISGRAGKRAWTAGLAGLVKTAAAEWPDAGVKAIDISREGAPSELVAERIVAECLSGGRDIEVGLGKGAARVVIHHRPAPCAPSSRKNAPLQPGSVVLVSGGARGVTAAALLSIGKYKPRLALIGRTELIPEPEETRPAETDSEIRRALLARANAAGSALHPKDLARNAKVILDRREIRSAMLALRNAGCEVAYYPVDVLNAEAVCRMVEDVRRAWGPIRGIVHGAGVLADALLTATTDAQFDLVFRTKVDGLHSLLAATEADPLELLIVFSSVAGRFGNAAQSAYGMANEVLSCVAAAERARRGPKCLVRSLAWGPWAGGMVTPALGRLFEKAGVQLLGIEAGAAAFARELDTADDRGQVILMNGVPPETARPLHRVAATKGQASGEATSPREEQIQDLEFRLPPNASR